MEFNNSHSACAHWFKKTLVRRCSSLSLSDSIKKKANNEFLLKKLCYNVQTEKQIKAKIY